MSSPNAHEFKLDEYIMHHVLNSQEWKIPFLPTIHLPEPLSLHAVMVMIAAVVLIVLATTLYNKNQRVPTGMTNVFEIIVLFIRDHIALPSLGKEDGVKFTPLLCTLFVFILTLNMLGLVPLFSTATANVNVTGALALVIFSFLTVGAIKRNGIGGFFHAFIPSGVPILILPVIFLLEFLGIFIKSFALMVRLFANMLAGHMVILSLLGLVVTIGYVATQSIILALGIYTLEVLVAFLQAFIFTLLAAVFIGQMYHPEH